MFSSPQSTSSPRSIASWRLFLISAFCASHACSQSASGRSAGGRPGQVRASPPLRQGLRLLTRRHARTPAKSCGSTPPDCAVCARPSYAPHLKTPLAAYRPCSALSAPNRNSCRIYSPSAPPAQSPVRSPHSSALLSSAVLYCPLLYCFLLCCTVLCSVYFPAEKYPFPAGKYVFLAKK